MVKPDIFPVAADRVARDLLAAGGLDGSDLVDARATTLYGRFTRSGLVGVIGLEALGERGLLRSLAVAPDARGQGHAHALVRHAEAVAAACGMRELFLLTETATDFFERLGYQRTDRSGAPEALRATTQFRMLCPADAVCMRKVLAPPPAPAGSDVTRL